MARPDNLGMSVERPISSKPAQTNSDVRSVILDVLQYIESLGIWYQSRLKKKGINSIRANSTNRSQFNIAGRAQACRSLTIVMKSATLMICSRWIGLYVT